MSIYVQHGGKQLGPFTEDQVKAQLASGTISLQDYAWWDGQKDWLPLGQSHWAPTPASLAPGSTPMPPVPPVPAAPIPAPYPVGGASTTSQLAIWALVCGCLGMFFSLLASIPAIILGHLGLSQIKKNPGMRGHGMALAGLILGYVFTALLPFISIVAISVLIALGNQVKGVFSTIDSQLAEAAATNSDDQPSAPTDQTTPPPATTPDQSTNTPAATPSDSATNAAPTTQ